MNIYIMIGIVLAITALLGAIIGLVGSAFLGKKKQKGTLYGALGFTLLMGISMVVQWMMHGQPYGIVLDGLRILLTELNGLIVALIALSVIFLLFGILYGIMQAATKGKEENLSRRKFFQKTAVVVPAALGVTGSVAAFQGNEELQLRSLELRLKDAPSSLRGYKIAQLSDIHIGPFITVDDLHIMVDVAAQTGANRLVITGDLIDDLTYLDAVADYLDSRVQDFPDGIDYILGNHEYRFDADYVYERLSQTKMHMYRNSHKQIIGGDRPVYLVGVDYNFKDDVRTYNQAFLDTAMEGMPSNAYPILLAHHPNFIVEAFRRHIPLTLSGHTHGGQINIGNISLVPVYRPYWKGLYEENGLFAYVSRGSGHWFPVRMNCAREVTLFTLN